MDFESYVLDPYKKTDDMKNVFRKGTAYCYLPSLEHYSPWDKDYPESPLRSSYIDDRLKDLLPKLQRVDQKNMITDGELDILSLVHDPSYIERLLTICTKAERSTAEQYDSIYFNGEQSYKSAVEAVKMATTMAKLVATGEYHNGFANVRPPGHHATVDAPNGYCFLNNVAIATKYLLKKKLTKRILIVDIDVHHGQGTQRAFYNSDEVLYVSLHRYEHGLFWPNLRESNFDFVGSGKGSGYNVNIPLNETGLTDTDYLAIFLNIILPLAYEFNPTIVIVSGGYDACLGCPEGQMNVTPAFYAHMVSLLSGLAEGKLLVVLEGGYFLPSLSEGAFQTVRSLLNYPCPSLEYHKRINPSVVKTINDVKAALMSYWKCFKDTESVCTVDDILNYDKYNEHVAEVKYLGTELKAPFPVVDCYPRNSELLTKLLLAKLDYLKGLYVKYEFNPNIAVAFNTEAHRHKPKETDRAQEIPKRFDSIKEKLEEFELLPQMVEYKVDKSDNEFKQSLDFAKRYIDETHSAEYLDILKTVGPERKPDLYWSEDSYAVCEYSCALLIRLIKDIKKKLFSHAVAVVRPPGHHAKRDKAGGFCLINNVAVASQFALDAGYKKILIVDFDVHHGDGTQDITYNKEDVMYISMHRFDQGNFFPKDQSGSYDRVGERAAAGFNANIAFENAKLGNVDFLYTWIRLVLPLAYSFSPDLIFVSAGFDAGISDPLGGYKVHPETFGHMVHLLKAVAPMIISLEGGYNLETTSLSMVNCTRALHGHPLPIPSLDKIQHQTVVAVENSIRVLKPYWPILEVNKAIDCNLRGSDVN